MVSEIGVNAVCEVENGCSVGEPEEVALWSEDEHLVFVQLHLEVVHQVAVVVVALERLAYAREPFVEARFALDAFVAPVCCQSALSDVVHALGAYLYLNPLAFGAHHGGVQRLVSVALGYAQPVAQTFRVGLVHICHQRVGHPALLFLLLQRAVEDDADSE